jgi:hypothetical protein
MSVTCVAWVYSFGHNPRWQDSNLWAKRRAVLFITRNITLPNDRFDSWIGALHTGMAFEWMCEATGHMLRLFTLSHPPPPPSHRGVTIKKGRDFNNIYWWAGNSDGRGAIRSLQILIYYCSTLSEEIFKDFELFVLTYLRVTQKIPLNRGYVLCAQLHTFASYCTLNSVTFF